MFKIIGAGAFAKAISYMLERSGGKWDNEDYEWVIPCIPSYALQSIDIEKDKKYILISKGLLEGGTLISEWARKINSEFVFLAGPHFVDEILNGLPTTTTIAGSIENFTSLKSFFPSSIYSNSVDFICLSSAMKNIVAYACGISTRQELGENFRASLITQGMKEVLEVAHALKIQYRIEDVLQPATMSDFILTGSSRKSRNFMAGYEKIIINNENALTESIHSAKLLIQRIGFSEKWPLISFVSNIMHGIEVDLKNIDLTNALTQAQFN